MAHDDIMRASVQGVAVACMHLVASRAILDFPSSTQAAPSRFVTIHLTVKGPLSSRWRRYFPMQVLGSAWEAAVVPVLQDSRFRLQTGALIPVVPGAPTTKFVLGNNHLLQAQYQNEEWSDLLSLFSSALILSYQGAGYLPTDEQMGEAPGPEVALDPIAPGEPLNREFEIPVDLEFTQFDC